MLVGIVALVIVLVGLARRGRRGQMSFDPAALRVGAAVAALGLACGLVVLVANGGHLPSTADALRTAGRPTRTDAGRPVEELRDRRLALLGDLVAWPAPLPFASVFGLPQLLGVTGLAVAMRLPERRRRVTRMELDDGRLWWDASPSGEDLEVQLPGATLTARDARLGVELTGDHGIIVVVEGAAHLHRDGTTVEISEGHGLQIGPGTDAGPEQLSVREVAADPWIGPHLRVADRRKRSRVEVDRATPWPLPVVVALVVLVLLGGVTYIVQVASVPSASMEPALSPGDRVVVAKAVGAPDAGDVVVFERPTSMDTGPLFLVKRVVAIGGQTVRIVDGEVHVDGRPQSEPYLPERTETTEVCGRRGEVTVPPGSYFVLGDNRDASFDSRCFGPVDSSQLVGTAVRRFPTGGTP